MNYKKLVYETYKGCRDILTIDLHNGYTVIAIKIWNSEANNYNVEFRLKENTVEKWDLIEKAESVQFEADYKTINKEILKYVSNLLSEGFFDYYIQRFDYYLKCFDTANEIFERESLGKK